jgi:uncharacterized membrane protein
VTALLNRSVGRRFAGLLIVCGCIMLAYANPTEHFPALASVMGLIYAAYVGGQSYTDGKQ